jgi:AcrR family transcriptional regulator
MKRPGEPRRRLTAEHRRLRILDAARQVFAVSGYDGASMSEVATAAGVTKPVLYDHFNSKVDLYGALLGDIRDELLVRGAEISTLPLAPEKRFRAAMEQFFRFAAEEPAAARLLLISPGAESAALAVYREVQEGATAGIARLLGTLWRLPAGQNLLASAQYLKAGMHGLALWAMDHPELTVQDLVDVVTRIAWYGLRSGRSRVRD